jgi:hypothetical protein
VSPTLYNFFSPILSFSLLKTKKKNVQKKMKNPLPPCDGLILYLQHGWQHIYTVEGLEGGELDLVLGSERGLLGFNRLIDRVHLALLSYHEVL